MLIGVGIVCIRLLRLTVEGHFLVNNYKVLNKIETLDIRFLTRHCPNVRAIWLGQKRQDRVADCKIPA